MNSIGLSKDESVIVSVIAPLIAVIGPCVACLLADRLAGGFGGPPRTTTGTYLRVMISLCLLLATIFYWILMIIPPIVHINAITASISQLTDFIADSQPAECDVHVRRAGGIRTARPVRRREDLLRMGLTCKSNSSRKCVLTLISC